MPDRQRGRVPQIAAVEGADIEPLAGTTLTGCSIRGELMSRCFCDQVIAAALDRDLLASRRTGLEATLIQGAGRRWREPKMVTYSGHRVRNHRRPVEVEELGSPKAATGRRLA